MSVSLDSILNLALVAFLYGVTNPFIKKGAQGLENVKSSSRFGQFFNELAFLVTKLKYIVPFIINQCGSILYFLTLSSTDISLAVPVTNSLTFVVTAITDTYIGMAMVLIGTFLCCWDKIDETL
ncbi:transmembrane protein 234 homolog isoform X2 [Hylaeus anthracinus]|uniref:transmembrane protein 234 homolog isoform X2 n=1 Tax=Hylaeus volcanicus TaxID=313075 RepID=UPI0023B7BE1C|nr:transmembrane protein 234 homolog isoform X2 [Hylaeus volcanicus]XP_054004487.1 transmembrane protein 234 homolog isoform X2 [Hylaeus anthracinus]